jgi:hypothetical protein
MAVSTPQPRTETDAASIAQYFESINKEISAYEYLIAQANPHTTVVANWKDHCRHASERLSMFNKLNDDYREVLEKVKNAPQLKDLLVKRTNDFTNEALSKLNQVFQRMVSYARSQNLKLEFSTDAKVAFPIGIEQVKIVRGPNNSIQVNIPCERPPQPPLMTRITKTFKSYIPRITISATALCLLTSAAVALTITDIPSTLLNQAQEVLAPYIAPVAAKVVEAAQVAFEYRQYAGIGGAVLGTLPHSINALKDKKYLKSGVITFGGLFMVSANRNPITNLLKTVQ